MNLSALQAEIYRRLDYTTSPPTAVSTRLTSFLNLAHRQIVSTPGLDSLRDDTITFASVASTPVYALPPAVNRIESITDRTTLLNLTARDLSEIRAMDPGLVQTGPPECYVNRGFQQVQTQPTAATGLWIVSSSAGDTTQSVKVETVRTGGYLFSGAATLNGITRVQVGTLSDHIEVVKFYVSAVGAGFISLFDAAAAGNELARIPIGGTYARYLQIQLWPTPTSAITYYVDYVREIADMSNATDEPLLPQDYHWLLVEGALMKEWVKLDDARRVISERDYLRGLSNLKYFVTCPPHYLPSRTGRGPERSRFGGYFPATNL